MSKQADRMFVKPAEGVVIRYATAPRSKLPVTGGWVPCNRRWQRFLAVKDAVKAEAPAVKAEAPAVKAEAPAVKAEESAE